MIQRRVFPGVCAACVAFALAAGVRAQSAPATTGPATTAPALTYPITELKLNYQFENKWQPPLGELSEISVSLSVLDGAYVAPRAGLPSAGVKLGEIGKGAIHRIDTSAILEIYTNLIKNFNDRGLGGVFVQVEPADIGSDEADRRGERRELNVAITVSQVMQVQTVRMDVSRKERRINDPGDAAILEGSPVKPVDAGGKGGPNLVDLKALDAYIAPLNREPGVRVEIEIGPTNERGKVVLMFLIWRETAATRPK